ncbi:MAG: T9SS type A sorting domain-containing protein [bacterium]|nr:T9SS type A sorting domain-containing protein [bacterium]
MKLTTVSSLFVLLFCFPEFASASDNHASSHKPLTKPSSTSVPKPFFFTENKGQWDARVLYKCQAKNGMTWFLERDGITLLLTQPGARDSDFGAQETGLSLRGSAATKQSHLGNGEQAIGNGEQGRGGWQPPTGGSVRRTFLSDDVMENDLPEMLRRHPARENVPMISHALKFHFVKSEGSKVKGEGSKVKGEGSKVKGEGSKVKGEGLKVNGERSTKEDSENLFQSFSTQHPTPYTLNPSPDFLHPTPYTLHQSFSTLHRAEAQSVEAQGELPWKNNYFLGNDSSKWAPNCRNFSTVVYREVWDGIDIEWYENEGKLEFDFIVHPGFDPSQIRMSVEGLEGDRISGFGDPESLLSLRERPAPKQSHLDKGNRERGTGNSRGVPRTPAVTGVGQTILSDKCSSRGRPSGSPDVNVRALLRDSRTTGGTVHRTFLSDGVMDSSRGVWHTPATTETTRTDMGVRPYPSPNTQHPSPIAQSPLPIAELLLSTSLGELRTALPSVYQISANGSRTEIEATFELTDQNTFGIVLPNGYNPDHSLRIDPLIYSTFLGGNDDDNGLDMCLDGNGGIILVGATESWNFPTTPGAFDPTISARDGYITHFNASGSQLLFSTSIGGGGDDGCTGVLIDSVGNVVVAGIARSGDFPTTSSFGPRGGDGDGFVTKLNSTGSAIQYSVVIGGSSTDQLDDLCSDGIGGYYASGLTASANFPITNALQNSMHGNSDGFLLHLNASGTQLLFCTFLGGNSIDGILAIDYDRSGYLWAAPTTLSSDFPITADAIDTSFGGGEGYDCALLCLTADGSQLLYSTYWGGSSYDVAQTVKVLNTNEVLVTGYTSSLDFPTTPGAFDTLHLGTRKAFVTKFNQNGRSVVFSTLLGGTGSDLAAPSDLSTNGSILITGQTNSADFPVTANCFDATYNGGGDCFVAVLDSTGSNLLYGTYLGGSNSDDGFCVTVDNNNDIYVSGITDSPSFPTTPNGFDPTYNAGFEDAFLTKIHIDTTDIATERILFPQTYSLSQNYPNPFNSSTTISYSLPKPGFVDLKLFDITGREVATLVNQKQQTGSYRVTIDGQHLSSGTYFVRMQSGDFVKTKKMVLLR